MAPSGVVGEEAPLPTRKPNGMDRQRGVCDNGRMRRLWVPLLVIVGCAVASQTARAAPSDSDDNPWKICAPAIAAAEKSVGIPRHLLLSIALVESGRQNEERGGYHPWPWTINAGGDGRFFESKTEAVAAVRDLRESLVRNIDVGCMQVNLHHHPTAFADLEAAFDPATNAAFAARFLRSLFRDTGSWLHAVARYHSSIYRNNRQYMIRVMKVWRQMGGGGRRARR